MELDECGAGAEHWYPLVLNHDALPSQNSALSPNSHSNDLRFDPESDAASTLQFGPEQDDSDGGDDCEAAESEDNENSESEDAASSDEDGDKCEDGESEDGESESSDSSLCTEAKVKEEVRAAAQQMRKKLKIDTGGECNHR